MSETDRADPNRAKDLPDIEEPKREASVILNATTEPKHARQIADNSELKIPDPRTDRLVVSARRAKHRKVSELPRIVAPAIESDPRPLVLPAIRSSRSYPSAKIWKFPRSLLSPPIEDEVNLFPSEKLPHQEGCKREAGGKSSEAIAAHSSTPILKLWETT